MQLLFFLRKIKQLANIVALGDICCAICKLLQHSSVFLFATLTFLLENSVIQKKKYPKQKCVTHSNGMTVQSANVLKKKKVKFNTDDVINWHTNYHHAEKITILVSAKRLKKSLTFSMSSSYFPWPFWNESSWNTSQSWRSVFPARHHWFIIYRLQWKDARTQNLAIFPL